MRYAAIFIALTAVWLAVVTVALVRSDTELTLQLYRLLIVFTLTVIVIGFKKRTA